MPSDLEVNSPTWSIFKLIQDFNAFRGYLNVWRRSDKNGDAFLEKKQIRAFSALSGMKIYVISPILSLPGFEPLRDFMHALVIFKFEENPIKNEDIIA